MYSGVKENKTNIGIIGCGAIGTSLALFIRQKLSAIARVGVVCDVEPSKAKLLAEDPQEPAEILGLEETVQASDLVIEAASASAASVVLKACITHSKDMLCLSSAGLIEYPLLFTNPVELLLSKLTVPRLFDQRGCSHRSFWC